jgi:hypothetical protein
VMIAVGIFLIIRGMRIGSVPVAAPVTEKPAAAS